MFIKRDYRRSVHDDYILNVRDRINKYEEAIEIIYNGEVIGWKIQSRYE